MENLLAVNLGVSSKGWSIIQKKTTCKAITKELFLLIIQDQGVQFLGKNLRSGKDGVVSFSSIHDIWLILHAYFNTFMYMFIDYIMYIHSVWYICASKLWCVMFCFVLCVCLLAGWLAGWLAGLLACLLARLLACLLSLLASLASLALLALLACLLACLFALLFVCLFVVCLFCFALFCFGLLCFLCLSVWVFCYLILAFVGAAGKLLLLLFSRNRRNMFQTRRVELHPIQLV